MAANRLPYELTKNGSIYVRLVIPPELLPFAEGKKALYRRIGASRQEAKRNHARALASAQDELDVIRARKAEAEGVEHRRAARRYAAMTPEAMARELYRTRLEMDDAARASPAYAAVGIDDVFVSNLRRAVAGSATNAELMDLIGSQLGSFHDRGNTDAEPLSAKWRSEGRVLAEAELEALERVAERDEGDFNGVPRMPALLVAEPEPAAIITFDEIIDAEVKWRTSGKDARGVKPATIRQFRHAAEDFAAFRKSDNATSVTAEEGEAWIAHLVTAGKLTAKTIKVRVVNVATVLSWGGKRFRGKMPPHNPLLGVEKPEGAYVPPEERTFTMNEARKILTVAQGETSAKFRFIPWMTAYSGARVSEIAQLRPEDFFQIGDDWFFRINTKGGKGVKTESSIRRVPVHVDLLALGLIEFVKGAPAGKPLFGTSVQPRMSEWMRDVVKLQREYMAPNHSWRHLFEDLCTLGGVIDDARSYMTGRSTRSSRDRYGRSEVALPGLAREMGKVPSILTVTTHQNN